MRIFICRHGRGHTPATIEELTTALLQEGHAVHVGKADRAARHFTPDLIVTRYQPGHFACAWLARRRRLPLCLLVDTAPRHPPSLFDRIIWRAATRVFATNAILKDAVAAAGVDHDRIDVFPGGAVLEHFLPPPFAPARASDAVVLGWFGGSAPEPTAAHDLALTVIDNSIPPVRAADLIAGIDIALFPHAAPSRLIDCMAARRTIVAPAAPEVRELLQHERTALLFDPTDDGALLRAAARLIADPALRARLCEAAHAELIRRDLTWRGLARRITSIAL
jgi:glycosyltransferase involved in cell wall biosynthesis